jgi:hypothetical protein
MLLGEELKRTEEARESGDESQIKMALVGTPTLAHNNKAGNQRALDVCVLAGRLPRRDLLGE